MNKIFYLHVSKTGGQTLAARMASAFQVGRASFMEGALEAPDGARQLGELFHQHDFVERHVHGPVLADMPPTDVLCTLREPIAQIVSNYLHIRREPAHPLHRPACELAPEVFFADYGDFLAHFQALQLVGAWMPLPPPTLSPERFLLEQLHACLDRIRWVVPTECIDDFTHWWALENQRRIPQDHVELNHAPAHPQRDALSDLVRSQPGLWGIDLVLWQAARQRHLAWRRRVEEQLLPFAHPADSTQAHAGADGSGIWLTEGWHAPQLDAEVGVAWWAGPAAVSEIRFRHRPPQHDLTFAIVVVCGVHADSLVALHADRTTRLPLHLGPRPDGGWQARVSLPRGMSAGLIYLCSPHVWSPMMMDAVTDDASRRSFATGHWGFTRSPSPALPTP